MFKKLLLAALIGVLSSNVDARQNYVTWPASTSKYAANWTGYHIYRCNPGPCTPNTLVGTTQTEQFFDISVANSTTYVYQITAYGPGGETFQPTTVSITTDAAPTTRSVTCSGDITTALQNAITASAVGDIVSISSGSCSVPAGLATINDFHGTIQGAGIGSTIISVSTSGAAFAYFNYSANSTPDVRLTGLEINNTINTTVQQVTVDCSNSSSWIGGFRIDHVNFNDPLGGANLYIFGPCWGLVDHNQFTITFESSFLVNAFLISEFNNVTGATPDINQLEGAYLFSQPFRPGAGDYIYVEDNTFTGQSNCGAMGGCFLTDTGYNGMRAVFRHNTITDMSFFSHWTNRDSINSLWWEIYNNSMSQTVDNVVVMRLEGGGTGLIYNNTITGFNGGLSGGNNVIEVGEQRLAGPGAGGLANSGPLLNYCDVADSGPQTFDGNLGDTNAVGWPCLAQTGRAAGYTINGLIGGQKQASFPLYLWNNGPTSTCQTGGACTNTFGVAADQPTFYKNTGHTVTGGGQGQGDVDWCINTSQPTGCGTHTLNYIAYPYPHPLNHP